MSVEYLASTAQKAIPSAADGVTVTPSGVTWGNSAWVELTASTGSAGYLTGIVVIGGPTGQYEIDIGVGASGSESVIATVPGNNVNTTVGPWRFPLVLPVDQIASGARVAARVRVDSTSTTTFKVSVTYLEKPLGGSDSVTTTSAIPTVVPSAASGTSVAGGASWANGSWVEFIASTSTDIVVAGIMAFVATNESEFDIGTGAAGSETVVGTVPFAWGTNPFQPQCFQPVRPGIKVASGTRVAVRLRGSGGTTPSVKLLYYQGAPSSSPQIITSGMACLPSAAGGTALPPPASWSSYTLGAIAQIASSAPADIAITGIIISEPSNPSDGVVVIYTGASGSETPLITVRFQCNSNNAAYLFALPVGVKVASGTRLSAALGTSSSFSGNAAVKLAYAPLTAVGQYVDGPMAIISSSSPYVLSVNSGVAAWASGSWVEFTSSAGSDWLLSALFVGAATGADFEIDIGTGAAGSESVLTMVRPGTCWLNSVFNGVQSLPEPYFIASGTRLAMRSRSSAGNQAINVGLMYVPNFSAGGGGGGGYVFPALTVAA